MKTKRESAAMVRPDLIKEWHPTLNGNSTLDDFTPNSNHIATWIDEKGHVWETAISHRVTAGTNCPYCAHKKLLKGFNDMATTHPHLGKEWHPTRNGDKKPSDFFAGKKEKAWWLCPACGNEWEARIDSRASGNGCPQCCRERHTSFPEQAFFYYVSKHMKAENRAQIEGYEIDIYIPEKSAGIEYNGSYFHRNRKCQDATKIAFFQQRGINVIVITEGNVASVDDGQIVYQPSLGRKALDDAIVAVLKKLDVPVTDVDTLRDFPAIYSQYVAARKENSIAARMPEIAKELHPTKNGLITADMLSCGSHKLAWWLCPVCGKDWVAQVYNRANGRGCPVCAGKQTKQGYNDLATLFEEYAKEWHPTKNDTLTPHDVTPGSGKKVWWQCLTCGYEWEAIIKNRCSRNQGCPECARAKRNYKKACPKYHREELLTA